MDAIDGLHLQGSFPSAQAASLVSLAQGSSLGVHSLLTCPLQGSPRTVHSMPVTGTLSFCGGLDCFGSTAEADDVPQNPGILSICPVKGGPASI